MTDMYEYVFEENGKQFKRLIRIEDYIDSLAHDHRNDELMILYRTKAADSEDVEIQKEITKTREWWERRIKEEEVRLDKFCEIMCTTDKSYQEAESESFGYHIDFDIFADVLTMDGKRLDEIKPRKRSKKKDDDSEELENEPEPEKRRIKFSSRVYLEQGFPERKRDALLARGYKRLKISPFGDTGAAYYWIKTRYNEGKEHAFFCYLIESELKKHVKKIRLNVNNGPDLVFEYKKKMYCFDVETGKKLQRSPVSVDWKYSKYQKEYDQIFILVTRKSLKYKYTKYGAVITRGKLKDTIAAIFA